MSKLSMLQKSFSAEINCHSLIPGSSRNSRSRRYPRFQSTEYCINCGMAPGGQTSSRSEQGDDHIMPASAIHQRADKLLRSSRQIAINQAYVIRCEIKL